MSKQGRRRARRLALKGAFALGKDLIGSLGASVAAVRFADDGEEGGQDCSEELLAALVAGFAAHREEAMERLEQHLEMPLDDVETLQRTALVLATVELIACPATPLAVIINEWVGITKEFGSPGGHRLVNAVLDQVRGSMNRYSTPERDIIARHFTFEPVPDGVSTGVGDDAAVVAAADRMCVTTDTLVAGTHFTASANPRCLGRKALAASLSDLAAMGSQPRYALLSLTFPVVDHGWLRGFSRGFRSMADEHGVALVGGDLSRGTETAVTVTALGDAPPQPLLQSGARSGDLLWLSGSIGAAGAELLAGTEPAEGSALHDPVPRVKLGAGLAGVASAAIDLSDGLCASAALLARASSVALRIAGESVPVSKAVSAADEGDGIIQAACSGEDYELLFTAPAEGSERITELGTQFDVPLACIGTVEEGNGATLVLGEKKHDIQQLARKSFDHFSTKDAARSPGWERLAGLAAELGELAGSRSLRLASAESCTGGLLAGALTSVPGSSDWFDCGYVAYTSAVKSALLGVSAELIGSHGVVSAEVAEAMSAGARTRASATHAAGITGWAGPEGGDAQEPGTVFIGLASEQGASSRGYLFKGTRHEVRMQAVEAALASWRDELLLQDRMADDSNE